jgi:predicted small metal-binding protein
MLRGETREELAETLRAHAWDAHSREMSIADADAALDAAARMEAGTTQGGGAMAWTYYCEDEDLTMVADTKEELTQIVKDHVNTGHGMNVDDDEARRMVDQNARQQAA